MIRRCRRGEAEAILGVINDAAEAYRGVIPDDRFKEPYFSRRELSEASMAGVAFWGYEEEGELIGVMGIQPLSGVTLIRHAYVRTARRRQGIGSELMRHLSERAAGTLLVGTWAAAAWAIDFYRRHGFEQVETGEKDRLLRLYWDIPERQVETSVVLRRTG
ncbi:MAG: GNAT family N-acetyltransferase [Candidatus Geothermincolia bacterium]